MLRTALIYHPQFLEHRSTGHPEGQQRVEVIMNTLQKYDMYNSLFHFRPEPASVDDIKVFHSPEYISRVHEITLQGGGMLDDDTFVTPYTFDVALMAVGALNQAVDIVMEGKVDNAFALVRPPGHHAEATHGMGFCIFNNVVLTALYARKKYNLERILIVDWDAHHGNGTQNAFYNDNSVLYFSIHQTGLFPGTGKIFDHGEGLGAGFTVNVPIPRGTTDAGYYFAFTHLLEPIARQYNPQLIIISAGQDAHFADPMAGLDITTDAYRMMTQSLKKIASETCGGKIIAALEGGYNLNVIGYAVGAIIDELAELEVGIKEPMNPPANILRPQTRIALDEAIAAQKKYWTL